MRTEAKLYEVIAARVENAASFLQVFAALTIAAAIAMAVTIVKGRRRPARD
jgi:hypothetical protein